MRIRLPFFELRPADTYEELCESLIKLDGAVEEIFERVELRLDEEWAKFKGFEERIKRASTKAQQVKGSTRAICVLSVAHYPAEDKLPDFRRLFYDEPKFTTTVEHTLVMRPRPKIEPQHTIVQRREAMQAALHQDADALPEYLLAIALCSELAANAPDEPSTLSTLEQGLGALPKVVSERGSASNLLLFNSEHNVYMHYRHFDNLAGEEKEEEPQKDPKAQLHEAPDTVRFGDNLPEVERTDFSYKPLLGEVPQLEVPSMLPDLKNVADLNWTAADLPLDRPLPG